MPKTPTRVVSADEAVSTVGSGAVVAVSGVLFNLVPEALCAALERRYLSSGQPTDLTEIHLYVFGFGAGTGIDHFAHPGLTRRVIGSSFPARPWADESAMNAMLFDDEVEAFVLPAGVIAGLFRATAAGLPGILSRVGLGTFVDPRAAGGAINPRAAASGHVMSKLVQEGGEEWLRYCAQPIDVSFILGSKADAEGNVTFEDEPLHQAAVTQAMATRASGGTVVVQVREVVDAGALDPRLVKLPSLWTDLIVEVTDQRPFAYGQDPGSPSIAGSEPPLVWPPPAPGFSAGTLVARRAMLEIGSGDLVNLGAGTPVRELPALIARSDRSDDVHVSIDHGSLGGASLGGLFAATHHNPTAIIDSNQVYDYYAGSGVDVALLGAAEVDGEGNVNVARAGGVVPGVGGFIDIFEAARTIVICGTLRRGGLQVSVVGDAPTIVREGAAPRFVRAVELVCLPAARARTLGKRVLYVTERAVFALGDHGLVLTEVAPGCTVADVRAAVDCDFDVDPDCRAMPAAVFAPADG